MAIETTVAQRWKFWLVFVSHKLNLNRGSESHTMSDLTEFERLIEQVAAGSEDAVWELVQTYTPYIRRSIRLSLAPKLRSRLDSQDIAQALWLSLLIGDADFSRMKSPNALIAFLARAAKNRVASQTKRHHAIKRDVAKEVSVNSQEFHDPITTAPAAAFDRDPTPSKIVAVRDKWDHLIANASKRDQRIVHMRMERQSFEAISSEVNVSEMTARRAIERLVNQLCQ
jgi:DNA-directed RNA polymerase specialized sigma24 family protein